MVDVQCSYHGRSMKRVDLSRTVFGDFGCVMGSSSSLDGPEAQRRSENDPDNQFRTNTYGQKVVPAPRLSEVLPLWLDVWPGLWISSGGIVGYFQQCLGCCVTFVGCRHVLLHWGLNL